MKKVIAFFMCALICLSVCACSGDKIEPDTSSSGTSYKEQTSSEDETSSEQSSSPKDTSSKPKKQTSSKNNNSKNTNSKNTSSKKNTIINDRPIDPWLTPTTPSGNTSSKGNVSYVAPEPEFVLGRDYGAIAYQGELVEMVCDKDTVYIICKNPNILVVYDSNSFQIKNYITLSGSPAEIHLEGQQIQISFPTLKRINMYDKNSLEQLSSITLPNQVCSFCIDGDLIYYGGSEQISYVYRTNLATNETVCITGDAPGHRWFSTPKLLLNKEKGILYVGESRISNSTVSYYRTSDFSRLYESKSVYNLAKTMFLVDGKLYWGAMILDSENPVGSEEYYTRTDAWSKLWHVDEKCIVNADKYYDRKSPSKAYLIGECGYSVITESENLVASYDNEDGKFIFSFPRHIYAE